MISVIRNNQLKFNFNYFDMKTLEKLLLATIHFIPGIVNRQSESPSGMNELKA